MKINRINKAVVVIIAALATVFLGAIAWRYVDSRYFSLKEAEPIIQNLVSEDQEKILEGLRTLCGYSRSSHSDGRYSLVSLEGHKPLRGAGEKAVSRLMLDILATSTNRSVLAATFWACTHHERAGVDLVNYSHEAKKIVADAIDRFNGPHARTGFTLMETEDGQWRVANFHVQH